MGPVQSAQARGIYDNFVGGSILKLENLSAKKSKNI